MHTNGDDASSRSGVIAAGNPKPTCGIVMPISPLDDCSAVHWAEVKQILLEAIDDAGFEGQLVSDFDNAGIIQKRIIQNLYENPIVVCDVSGKNPNVMFELGLRLAFDKPTIIVKDEKTTYSFDTGQIEHLEYPRDLRYQKIIDFQEKLSERITGTYQKANTDPTYTTFLKHFGEFKIAKIEKKEVPSQEFIIDELKSIREAVQRLGRTALIPEKLQLESKPLNFCLRGVAESEIQNAIRKLSELPEVTSVRVRNQRDHSHMIIKGDIDPILRRRIRAIVPPRHAVELAPLSDQNTADEPKGEQGLSTDTVRPAPHLP